MQREGEEKRAVHCCWRIVFVSLYPWKAHTGTRKKKSSRKEMQDSVCAKFILNIRLRYIVSTRKHLQIL